MNGMRKMFALTTLMMLASVAAQAQAATVTCKDGSSSRSGRGACSGHGGVIAAEKAEVKAAVKAETKAEKAETKAEMKAAKAEKKEMKAEKKIAKEEGVAIAECKDGSKSYASSHTGACSRHGGVKEWLDAKKR